MKSVLLVLAVLGAANACKLPPSHWCDAKEIAVQCKVFDQCKEWVWREEQQAPPVNLELYFESLCPDCQLFITKELYPTYQRIGSIMNVSLIPYGNANEKKGAKGLWEFECQHGEEECLGNLLETCAIHVLNDDMDKVLPFIFCVEASREPPKMAVKECADKLGVPLDPILNCSTSALGNHLEHEMALRTGRLIPRHYYVPWIVLNGVHTKKINDEATSNLLKLICDTYTGPKPSACSESLGTRVCKRWDRFEMNDADDASLPFVRLVEG